jgi:hypothetical protein
MSPCPRLCRLKPAISLIQRKVSGALSMKAPKPKDRHLAQDESADQDCEGHRGHGFCPLLNQP